MRHESLTLRRTLRDREGTVGSLSSKTQGMSGDLGMSPQVAAAERQQDWEGENWKGRKGERERGKKGGRQRDKHTQRGKQTDTQTHSNRQAGR